MMQMETKMQVMTNRQWAQLGHDMSKFKNAWEDATFAGTGTAIAELSESFERVRYVLDIDADTLKRRAESYVGLDVEWVDDLLAFDWESLVNDCE